MSCPEHFGKKNMLERIVLKLQHSTAAITIGTVKIVLIIFWIKKSSAAEKIETLWTKGIWERQQVLTSWLTSQTQKKICKVYGWITSKSRSCIYSYQRTLCMKFANQ